MRGKPQTGLRKRMGLLGPSLDTPRPRRIPQTRQFAGPIIPAACPHCHTADAGWARDEASGHCLACGATFFKALYTYRPWIAGAKGASA